VLLLAATRGGSDAGTGVTDISSSVKKIPREIYSSGGGLLVAPTNTPHLRLRRSKQYAALSLCPAVTQ